MKKFILCALALSTTSGLIIQAKNKPTTNETPASSAATPIKEAAFQKCIDLTPGHEICLNINNGHPYFKEKNGKQSSVPLEYFGQETYNKVQKMLVLMNQPTTTKPIAEAQESLQQVLQKATSLKQLHTLEEKCRKLRLIATQKETASALWQLISHHGPLPIQKVLSQADKLAQQEEDIAIINRLWKKTNQQSQTKQTLKSKISDFWKKFIKQHTA